MVLKRRVVLPGIFAVVALSIATSALPLQAEDARQVITLAAPPAKAAEEAVQPSGARPKAVSSRVITRPDGVQEVYREFGSAKVGQDATPEYFLLQFHAATKVTAITASGDFHVVPGGTCIEGYTYAAGQSCDVKMVFTPTGPGHRNGQLSVAHSDSATPFVTPTGGQAYGPAVSFVPSLISTVPGTLSGSGTSAAGTLQQPQELAVDGGDNLYIADTGNNLVKLIDSTGTIKTITGGGTASPVGASGAGTGFALKSPTGVAADPYGHLFVVVEDAPALLEQYANGYATDIFNPNGSNISCHYNSPCQASSVYLYYPTSIAADLYGNVFFNEPLGDAGGVSIYYPAELTPNAAADEFTSLYTNSLSYITVPQLAVDSNDDLLYPWGPLSGICQIAAQNQQFGETATGETWVVAGSGPCGFSGDGGRAGSAEIGQSIGQIAFDLAGNVYFTDSSNNRVRRVDAVSGVIRTIAGNGTTGYGGDGGASTGANLQAPGGVAVDSTGKVYATAIGGSSTLYNDIRSFGTIGFLNLGSLAVGTSSTTQTVLLSNVGNDTLNFFHIAVGSGNTSDFTIDPNTTTCIVGVALQSGHNCNIGLIFTPTATGSRAASVLVADDTVNGLNTIQVSGTGYTTATLTPASFSYANTTVGSSSAAQTATLTNTGKAAMTISSILFSGAAATSYTDTTTCGTTLAVAASCTISVVFKPATTGTLAATLTVTDNAITGRQTVTLTGVGVAAAVAKPALAPASLTFASQTVGTASAAQTIKLSNTGTASLGVTSIKMAGTDPGDYAVSNNCGTSVAAGGYCTITVTFKPAAAGTRTATVSVVTATGTLTDAVTGTSVAAAVKPKVTLNSAANPVAMNQTLRFTAQVIGSPTAAPAGTVRLMEGGKMWTEGVLAGGTVTMKVRGLPIGVHLLTAVYMGDGKNSEASSAELRQVVAPAPRITRADESEGNQ